MSTVDTSHISVGDPRTHWKVRSLCPSKEPTTLLPPFLCTAPLGHSGHHIGEGNSEVLGVWPNEEEEGHE